jgi:hypothetical protein
VRSSASLRMSISGTASHRRETSFLIRRRFRGSGAASSGVSLIAPWRRSLTSTQSRSGSASLRSWRAVVISRRSDPEKTAGSGGLRSSR